MFAAAASIATSSPSQAPHISKCLISQSPAGQTSMTGRNDIICRQAYSSQLPSFSVAANVC